MLFPMVTLAYWYAYEARPHGIVLGFCGIALVCWQAAAEHNARRFWSLLGLGLALAGALLTHSYAFLIFLPVVCGEVARNVRRGSVDWPMWATITMSSTTLLASLPLLHRVKSNLSSDQFFVARASAVVDTYRFLLNPATVFLTGWLVLTCSAARIMLAAQQSEEDVRPHERIAFLAFLGIPIFAYLVAKVTGAPLLPRYSISFVAGIACLLGFAAAKKPIVAIIAVLLIAGQVGLDLRRFASSSTLTDPVYPTVTYPVAYRIFMERYSWMDADEDKTLPIVLLGDHDSLPTSYYAPTSIASRFVYLLRPEASLKGYSVLRTCCNAPPKTVQPLDFLRAHAAFLILSPSNSDRPNFFIGDGAVVVVKRMSQDYILLDVRYRTNVEKSVSVSDNRPRQ
jgi:hypothetical protein